MSGKITTDLGTFTSTPQDDSLLEALERTGHEIEYQCRQGYCGACRTSIVSGNVEYHVEPLAAVSFKSILPCCCKAKGDIELAIPVFEST